MNTRIAAYGIFISENKIYLTQKKGGPFKNAWDFPGGKIELHETPLQALHRESIEEAALQVNQAELKSVETYTDPHFHMIGIIYEVVSFTEVSGSKEEEGKWFDLDQLPEVTPFVKRTLKVSSH